MNSYRSCRDNSANRVRQAMVSASGFEIDLLLKEQAQNEQAAARGVGDHNCAQAGEMVDDEIV
jgi:hypothetical protein